MLATPAPRRSQGARRRRAALLTLAVCALASGSASSDAAQVSRLVSLNPSLTEIVVSLGAAPALAGVDDYSAELLPEVARLPRVGGLFSPSLEAVVALSPDLVVLVPSVEQRDFVGRLEQLGIAVEVFDNIRFADVLENIERLGRLLGREAAATERIAANRRARDAARAACAGLARVRVLAVLQRDPVFVVGRGSFLDEMIEALGAANLANEFAEPYPQVAVEWVVARAPEVLIDLASEPREASPFWSRWPSLPAVAAGRVVTLDAAQVTMPGPYLDRALAKLARALRGDAVADAVAKAAATP